MQRSLFLLILMGQSFFITCRLYEYHFINNLMTWERAQNYCRTNYTDLATAYNMTNITDMETRFGNNDDAWIGLYYNQTSTNMQERSLSMEKFNETRTEWEQCVEHNNNGQNPMNECDKYQTFICCFESNPPHKNMKCKRLDEEMSWEDAQSHCKPQQSLIGLIRDTWRWSDGSSFKFTDWDPKKHDNDGCASSESGKWKFNKCEDKKPFICYQDKIILIKQNKTWQEAINYCREKHNDLISITDVHQQSWVQERAKSAQTEFIWLGLRYTCTLDMWFWVTGEDFIYDNWESCPPTHGCYSGAAMKKDKDNKWVTKGDNETFNFICTL